MIRAGTDMHDACYHKAMASYGKWSARAAQAVAKCRKQHHAVRKSKAGTSLRRWQRERWVDTRTGKPCGHPGKAAEYCRPSKKVSRKTPTMYRGKTLKRMQAKKARGQRATK